MQSALSMCINDSELEQVRNEFIYQVRLMFDILQKRNFAGAKVTSNEEKLTAALAELSLCPEMKHVSVEKVVAVMHFMNELSATNRDPPKNLNGELERYVQCNLLHPPAATPATITAVTPPRIVKQKKNLDSEVFALAMPSPEKTELAAIPEAPETKAKKVHRQERRIPLRMTKARAEVPRAVKFEHHSDNSCCENGPVDEDDLIRERKGSIRMAGRPLLKSALKEDSLDDTTLYLLNDISQKLNLPLSRSPPDMRSRLRLRKNV